MLMTTCMLSACEIINPSEPVPGYIRIDSIAMNSQYSTQGSSNSRYTDVWVSVNNNYLGTYELPVTLPVIADGSTKISLRGGIMANGIAANRQAYPKASTYDTTFGMNPGKIHQMNPVISYLPGTVFSQIEDFDDGSLSLVNTGNATASLQITSQNDPNRFEGNSGFVTIDANQSLFEVASASAFPLPWNTEVFIELNYKCQTEFTVGMFITTSSTVFQYPLVNIRPTSEWKKIYINISELQGIVSDGIAYKVYLRSDFNSSSTAGTIYLDNLKVLY